MLAVARSNRRLIAAADARGGFEFSDIAKVKRAVAGEFAIGLAIVGLTAAMVVSPPALSASVEAVLNYIV
jgi:hypothetical protein